MEVNCRIFGVSRHITL